MTMKKKIAALLAGCILAMSLSATTFAAEYYEEVVTDVVGIQPLCNLPAHPPGQPKPPEGNI